ncbi:MAG: translation elongation factor Ts, partial [Planctomycetota bacterium]
MAEISAKDVMSLRNRTGLAMMECKKALAEAEGDVDKAEELLRKKLKGKMEKRADRAAGEGRVAVALAGDGSAAAILELRAETDFTAKNEQFIETADKLAAMALASGSDGDVAQNAEMESMIDAIRAKTGENISMPRARRVSGQGGTTFGKYVHHDGKTGVLLVASGDVSTDDLAKVGM